MTTSSDEPGGDEAGDDERTVARDDERRHPRADVLAAQGIDRPETNSVTTMTTNGTASVSPSFAHSGHQSFVLDRKRSSDWSTPSASAPMSATHSELNRAISATANAGTTSSVRLPGARTPTAGPAMMRTKLTNVVASTHVMVPSAGGERRANAAARSFSAAAWMARPVRERPNQTASAALSATTTAISQSRSTGTGNPATVTAPVGSTVPRRRSSVSYLSAIAAEIVTISPIAPITLASTGAVRSGRDTATSTTAPRAAATASATTTAAHVGNDTSNDGTHGNGSVSRPRSRSSNTYNATVAIAPAAKLMTPVPW